MGHTLLGSKDTTCLLEWQLAPVTHVLVVSLLEVRNDLYQLAYQLLK